MHKLPLAGHSVMDITGEGRLELRFDDAAGSLLSIEGAFALQSDDARHECEPPCEAWILEILSGLIGVAIAEATYDPHGNLVLSFEDGRQLRVSDGPFESWEYSNAAGMRAVGGMGRVVTWGTLPQRGT